MIMNVKLTHFCCLQVFCSDMALDLELAANPCIKAYSTSKMRIDQEKLTHICSLEW